MVCSVCGVQAGTGARFCSGCGCAFAGHAAGYVHGRLVRPRYGRVIAGVCVGFAARYGWDPIVVRLVLVLALFFGVGTPVLAYLIAWIVMPNAPFALPMRTGPVSAAGPTGPATS